MSGELIKFNISPELKYKFTLNPAAHLSEVEWKPYRHGRVIRSTLGTHCQDAFIFIGGAFYGELFDETGGQPGILDFIIPHYFVYCALHTLMKSNFNSVWLNILQIAGFVILGIINLTLSVLQKTLALGLFIVSFPIIKIVDVVCNSIYIEKKELVKNLMICHAEVGNEIPLENIFSPEPESVDDDSKEEVTGLASGKILSYKDIFSDLTATTQLVRDDNDNLFINVARSETDVFGIRVNSEDPEPLRNALYLNIFGITRSLETTSTFGDISDLHTVENVLSA